MYKIWFSALVCGFIFTAMAPVAHAGNIEQTEPNHWAWNDIIGWIDFGTVSGDIDVSDIKIDGYAETDSIGEIALDCETSPAGNGCAGGAGGDWFVSNDGAGGLAGWAWNDVIGWVSFCGNASANSVWNNLSGTWECPASPTYRVVIGDVAVGEFSGYAWNDVVGWISFNCNQEAVGGGNTCGDIEYRVVTSWGIVPPPPGKANLTITKNVINDEGGRSTPGEFTMLITAGNPSENNFPGSAAGITVSIDPGTYSVDETGPGGYEKSLSSGCSGTAVEGASYTCTITNDDTGLPVVIDGYLESNVFDTCPLGENCGAALNSITWQGQKSGGEVQFRLAASDSPTGPWTFVGPDDTVSSTYPELGSSVPGIPIPVKQTPSIRNKRYIRYKVLLGANISPSATPRIDDVLINWSP